MRLDHIIPCSFVKERTTYGERKRKEKREKREKREKKEETGNEKKGKAPKAGFCFPSPELDKKKQIIAW